MPVDKDRKKDRFKTWKLVVSESFHFSSAELLY